MREACRITHWKWQSGEGFFFNCKPVFCSQEADLQGFCAVCLGNYFSTFRNVLPSSSGSWVREFIHNLKNGGRTFLGNVGKNMAAFKRDRGLAVQVPLDLGDSAVIYCTVRFCGIHSCLFLSRTHFTVLIFFKEIA